MLKLKRVRALLILVALASSATSNAVSYTRIGRYQYEINRPSVQQNDLVKQTVHKIRFPSFVKTVGQAVDYILYPSGYKLVSGQKLDVRVRRLLAMRLPSVDRYFGSMPLNVALETLVGRPYQTRFNRVTREVSFALPDEHRAKKVRSHSNHLTHRCRRHQVCSKRGQ